jgi:hypothetical protein
MILPQLAPEYVLEAQIHGHWKTHRTEFASRLKYAMEVCNYAHEWAGFDNFIDRLRREALHPSFGWIQSVYGVDFDLEMGQRILNNRLKVRRVCTTTWKARRGGAPETQVVTLGIQLPGSKEQFLVAAAPEKVDALGCCSVEGAWKTVSVGGLDAFGAIVTSAFVKEFFMFGKLNRSTRPRKQNLPCKCVHKQPHFKRSFHWSLVSCSVCGKV